jgi:hypothetical protein
MNKRAQNSDSVSTDSEKKICNGWNEVGQTKGKKKQF